MSRTLVSTTPHVGTSESKKNLRAIVRSVSSVTAVSLKVSFICTHEVVPVPLKVNQFNCCFELQGTPDTIECKSV